MSAETIPNGASDSIGALLAAASRASTREMRIVYTALARVRLEQAAARVEELRLLVDAQERESARTAAPTQTKLLPTTEET